VVRDEGEDDGIARFGGVVAVRHLIALRRHQQGPGQRPDDGRPGDGADAGHRELERIAHAAGEGAERGPPQPEERRAARHEQDHEEQITPAQLAEDGEPDLPRQLDRRGVECGEGGGAHLAQRCGGGGGIGARRNVDGGELLRLDLGRAVERLRQLVELGGRALQPQGDPLADLGGVAAAGTEQPDVGRQVGVVDLPAGEVALVIVAIGERGVDGQIARDEGGEDRQKEEDHDHDGSGHGEAILPQPAPRLGPESAVGGRATHS
jgi:hypothetical protein